MTAHSDVLIRADPDSLTHKLARNLDADEVAYWRVSGTPRQTDAGQLIAFARDGRIHTVGEITGVAEGRLYFEAAERTDRPVPRDPPTRGFTYVELEDVPAR